MTSMQRPGAVMGGICIFKYGVGSLSHNSRALFLGLNLPAGNTLSRHCPGSTKSRTYCWPEVTGLDNKVRSNREH